jgi:hypothetical protein
MRKVSEISKDFRGKGDRCVGQWGVPGQGMKVAQRLRFFEE